jgi:diguanylate cyclase
MDSLVAQLSGTVSAAQSLEELTRPMLEMLQAVTGIESTYLTSVDLGEGVQRILYSRNSGHLEITEGLDVPWEATLCSRSIGLERIYFDDAAARWADAELAVELDIQTYFSMPISTASGGLYGTLCGASTTVLPEHSHVESLLTLFSTLIAQHLEREYLFQRLQHANAELASHASTDSLTGLPNRRSLIDTLRRMLGTAERESRSVLVGFIDLDDFKSVNDQFGHERGDEFLVSIAARLDGSIRTGDMLARIGGDEFVFIGLGPTAADAQHARGTELTADLSTTELATRLIESTIGRYELSGDSIDYSGASVGVVSVTGGTAEEAIRLADAEMYFTKRKRRAQLHGRK